MVSTTIWQDSLKAGLGIAESIRQKAGTHACNIDKIDKTTQIAKDGLSDRRSTL